MPFTPKDWRNAAAHDGGGDTSTPISAAALEDLEDRVTDYADSLIAALPTLAASTYTPTLTNTTNLDGSTANASTQYMRLGSVVTVSGRFDIDPTAAANTVMGISLPVASNLGSNADAGGAAVAVSATTEAFAISGDSGNDRATLQGGATITTNHTVAFIFQYRII